MAGMDISIAVLLGIITLGLAYMGVHVTLNPPESRREKLLWRFGFISASLIACALIGIQTYRNGKVMDTILRSQNALVREQYIEPVHDQDTIESGHTLTFRVGYLPTNNVAHLKSLHQVIVTADGPSRIGEANMYAVAGALSQYIRNDVGTDYAATTPVHITTSVMANLTDPNVQAIMNWRNTLYIVGYTEWRNPSGSTDHTILCAWLEPPLDRRITKDSAWHFCRAASPVQ